MMHLIKYTLTVVFSIKDITRQLHNNNLLNMKSKNSLFYQKNTLNLDKKVDHRQNTVCLEQQIYASPIFFRHLDGLPLTLINQ